MHGSCGHRHPSSQQPAPRDIESVLMAASNLASGTNDTYALRRYQDLLRVSPEMQARLVRFYDRATRDLSGRLTPLEDIQQKPCSGRTRLPRGRESGELPPASKPIPGHVARGVDERIRPGCVGRGASGGPAARGAARGKLAGMCRPGSFRRTPGGVALRAGAAAIRTQNCIFDASNS